MICFGVTAALLLASIWHGVALIGFIRGITRGGAPDQAFAAFLDGADLTITFARLFTLIVTAVAFCMWLHRSQANLVAAQVPDLKYTPRRAVEAFFIPFVNLVRPFRVVRETWSASEAVAVARPVAPGWQTTEAHWVVAVWWLSMLLGNGYSRYANAALDAAQTPAALMRYARHGITADGVTLVAAAAAIYIVWTITAWQEGVRANAAEAASV
jgi:hypothetical protein